VISLKVPFTFTAKNSSCPALKVPPLERIFTVTVAYPAQGTTICVPAPLALVQVADCDPLDAPTTGRLASSEASTTGNELALVLAPSVILAPPTEARFSDTTGVLPTRATFKLLLLSKVKAN